MVYLPINFADPENNLEGLPNSTIIGVAIGILIGLIILVITIITVIHHFRQKSSPNKQSDTEEMKDQRRP